MVEVEKLENYSEWIPEDRDIEWTENFLNNIKDSEVPLWVTSSYSLKIYKKEKFIELTDINFIPYNDPKTTFEDVSRIIKVLKKLGWNIKMDKKLVFNLDLYTRLIPEVGLIDKNKFIPTCEYHTKN